MPFPISECSPIAYAGPPPKDTDVVVIGGGVIGVCTALFLAEAGKRVVLLEKGRIAGEQSSRNWGWIRQQGRDPDEIPIMAEAKQILDTMNIKSEDVKLHSIIKDNIINHDNELKDLSILFKKIYNDN